MVLYIIKMASRIRKREREMSCASEMEGESEEERSEVENVKKWHRSRYHCTNVYLGVWAQCSTGDGYNNEGKRGIEQTNLPTYLH